MVEKEKTCFINKPDYCFEDLMKNKELCNKEKVKFFYHIKTTLYFLNKISQDNKYSKRDIIDLEL